MRHVVPALALSLAACVTATQQAAPASPAAEPFDAKKLAARELAPLPRRPLVFPQELLTTTTEAAGEPTFDDSNGAPQVNIPIGTDAVVNCTPRENLDAASTTTTLLKALGGGFEIERFVVSEVAAVAGTPILFTEVLYLAPGPQGKLLGLLKLAVVTGESSLICLHDELGYSDTFRRIVKDLVRSRTGVEEADTTRFSEISAVRLGETLVGFATRLLLEGNGRHVTISTTSMLIPKSDSESLAFDTASIETADQAGAVLESRHVRVREGEIVIDVTLAANEQGYSSAGTWNGKKVEGQIESRAPVASTVLYAELLRAFSTRAGPPLALANWVPSEDPTRLVEIRHERLEDRAGWVAARNGEQVIHLKPDVQGLSDETEVPMPKGPLLTVKRLSARGKLPPLVAPVAGGQE